MPPARPRGPRAAHPPGPGARRPSPSVASSRAAPPGSGTPRRPRRRCGAAAPSCAASRARRTRRAREANVGVVADAKRPRRADHVVAQRENAARRQRADEVVPPGETRASRESHAVSVEGCVVMRGGAKAMDGKRRGSNGRATRNFVHTLGASPRDPRGEGRPTRDCDLQTHLRHHFFCVFVGHGPGASSVGARPVLLCPYTHLHSAVSAAPCSFLNT